MNQRQGQRVEYLTGPMDNVEDCLQSQWTEWEEVVASQLDVKTPLPAEHPFFQDELNLFAQNPVVASDPNQFSTLLNTGTPEAPMLVMAVSYAYSAQPEAAAIPGIAVPSDTTVTPAVFAPPAAGAANQPATFELGANAQRVYQSYAMTRRLRIKQGRCVLLETGLSDIGFYRQMLWRGWGEALLPMQCYIEQLNDRLAELEFAKRFVPINAEEGVDLEVAPLFSPLASSSMGSAEVSGYGGSTRRMKVLAEPFLLVPGTPINAAIFKNTTGGVFDDDVNDDFGLPQNCGMGGGLGAVITDGQTPVGQATSWAFKMADVDMALLLYGFYITPTCATKYLEMVYAGNFAQIRPRAYGGLSLPVGAGISMPKGAE
jgi:hypothetical protein